MTVAGYARTGKSGELPPFIARLKNAGCSAVYTDTCDGLPNEGPALLQAITAAGYGGTLTVAAVAHLTEFHPQYGFLARALERMHIRLRSLEEGTDAAHASGRHTLDRAAIEADYLAAVTVGEAAYRQAEQSLSQWEPLLAATEAAVIGARMETEAARVAIPELAAELDRLTDSFVHGEMDARTLIAKSKPVNELMSYMLGGHDYLWGVHPVG